MGSQIVHRVCKTNNNKGSTQPPDVDYSVAHFIGGECYVLNLDKKYTSSAFSFKRQWNGTDLAWQQSLPFPLLKGTAVTEMFQLPGLPTQGYC